MLPIESVIYLVSAFILSGVIVYMVVPGIIKSCKKHGLMATDVHKPNKPEIAEPGGIAILIAFIFSILLIILFQSVLDLLLKYSIIDLILYPGVVSDTVTVNHVLLAAVLSVVIAGLIGFIDDVFKIRWRTKILLGFLPALPLMVLQVGKTTVYVPILGPVPFGILYPLLIVPLAVNFAFNSYNMLAGMNGMETGLGIISLATILVASIIPPLISAHLAVNLDVIIFLACLLGALVVFLKFNWTPAKILIGDSGTLTIGTALYVALVIGNMEWLAVGIFAIYLLNFILFLFYILTKQKAKLATVDEQGKLIAPCPYTMYWIFPYYLKNMTEKKNVLALYGVQTVMCVFGLLLFLFFALT
ncbi:MAG: hypothetical protein ACFFDI_15190 [Promethearchaeota archaeon]